MQTGRGRERPLESSQCLHRAVCWQEETIVAAEQQILSVARWDSVASGLSLLTGTICLSLPRNGKDWIYFFAQLHCMNVSRNATEMSCLWEEIFMVRDCFVGVACC